MLQSVRDATAKACIAFLFLAVTIMPSILHADTQPHHPSRALASHPHLEAATGDVATIDAIVEALAKTISAPAGGVIDNKRLASLFIPGGRIVIGVDPKPGRLADVVLVSPNEYADSFNRAMKASSGREGGFFDRVVANRVEHFGIMAHVYSSYESRESPSDPKPFRRGIKSIELLKSGERWYIVELYYDFERPGTPISATYMKPSRE